MSGRGRLLAFGGAALLAVLTAVYVVSPFITLSELAKAVRDDDRDRLSVLVDFPAVRTGLKEQFAALIARRASDNQDLAKNPFGSLVLMLVPKILDTIVDGIVTPDGIAILLARPLEAGTPGNHGSHIDPGDRFTRSWSFIGLDGFKVEYRSVRDPEVVFGLVFELRGLSWKLVRLDLPDDELSRRFGGTSHESPE